MIMENAVSYSITEAAEALKLSAKTIRRYIKAGKLPSVKVMTKFGEEYRITEIPEALKREAEAQAQAQAKVDLVVTEQKPGSTLDAQLLYQENIRLAAQLGAATERIRQLEDKLKLLEAPKEASTASKKPWWKRLLNLK
jgi:MerR family copper efflux transcriptional regulator